MARQSASPSRFTPRKPAGDAPPALGAVRGALPSSQKPQLATSAEQAPEGSKWISEIKLDGYRLLIWIDHGKVRLMTRNGHDWTPRLPRLAAHFMGLDLKTALLDGEMVALRNDGSSHFHDLQAALSAGQDADLYFFAFDLLHLDGWDLRRCALRDRKRLLEAAHGWGGRLRYADHVDGNAAGLQREACRLKLEGVISKRADMPYKAGRSSDWVKLKCLGRAEFVVLGWTRPGGSRQGIGSLALGYYDAKKRLHFAGAVGTGFSDQELIALRTRLQAAPSQKPDCLLVAGEHPDRLIRWIAPEMVVEVSFTAWSGDGRVRHAVYHGVREDKTPHEVVMDVPDPDSPRREVKPVSIVSTGPRSPSRWKGAVPPLRKSA